ncbi:MAG: ArgK/MeaB family GTPase [Thermoplasmata archaeon]
MESIEDLISSAKKGSRRSIGRLITIIENRSTGYEDILRFLNSKFNKAYVLGITGPPGVGKSSLISKLVENFQSKEKLAVIMIDATSPFSGGSLLGNRLRLSDGENIYVRSMATRGISGGLNLAIGDTLDLLSFLGFSMIIVESVGAGQDETDIVYFTDTVVLVLSPGTGDQVQAMKAGQMEIGDIIVLNKADRPDVIISEKELMEILSIPDMAKNHKLFKVSSLTGSGIKDLVAAIDEEKNSGLRSSSELKEREKEKLKQEILARINLKEYLIERLADKVVKGEIKEREALSLILKELEMKN